MCEWLSNAEWCDVQLLCKGRIFSAHRAVLASVSAFMRKILLSSSEETSATIMVLPDFDVKAMFSVLYYIYNGEVVVAKSNLQYFLDIIITLEIYVDQHFLNLIQPYIKGFDDKFARIKIYNSKFMKELKSESNLKLESNYDDKFYVTIRKTQSQIKQGSVGCVDVSDTELHCKRAQQQRPYLENNHSKHGDRQKKSFLRDSFIGTYPRNGNVNGHDPAVPAIPNEIYLDTTSALLTNANDIDHRLSDPLSVASKIEFGDQVIRSNENNSHFFQNSMLFNSCEARNANNSYLFLYSAPTTLMENKTVEKQISNHLDLRMNQSLINDTIISIYPDSRGSITTVNKPDSQVKSYLNVSNSKRDMGKTTISNRVMQSPWCPRLPINYKPFRRKIINKKDENNEFVVNDKNNNTESSIELPRDTENEKQLKDNSIQSETITVDDFRDVSTLSVQTLESNSSTTNHSTLSSARFTCPECGKNFSQLRNFKYHMSVHRGTREFAATCTVCGKYFNDRGYLSSHMKIHRNRKEYKCQLCPKSFNQRVAYNMHVRIHTGVKPHVCAECGKAFSRKMLLKQHQRTHSGERPYACPHCDKRFADRSNMTLHLRLHTGVKPFSCTLCPKSFTKKHHLKSHLNYHTGAKPYPCPRCQLGFTQSSNMRTHLKKCTAPLPEVSDSGSTTN